ncbi:V-type ATP synthase subunit I [Fonticella tunisiensis]|uniref:V/A-type H+-transporting ATPase subunit I n=1 Tax=Fonticella tunisiensis TaxID=1096341 RepID=A0A4R7KAG7_9CLOT|nr:V-type ATP synthase subunit I [Fonticella tunisiensis]TDT50935.1 V/A-type H+-transporting ATPase subunit I [Fonticella tunisiensis]
MAIVKMKKLTIAAPLGDRDRLLNTLQTLGNVHLIDLKDKINDTSDVEIFEEAKSVSQTEIEFNHIKFTYDFLRRFHRERVGLFSKREIISKEEFEELENKINWRSIYAEAKGIEEALGMNRNKRNRVLSSAEQYRQWSSLDISIKELEKLKKTAYFVGVISGRYEAQLNDELTSNFEDVYIERVSDTQQDIGLFILCHRDDLNKVSDILKKYGFAKANIDLAEVPVNKLKRLQEELVNIDDEYDKLIKRAEELSKNAGDIEKMFDYLSTRLEKERAISNLIKTRKTLILQGWVPEDEAKKVSETLNHNFKDVYIDFEEPEEDDNPPIAFKNNALVEPFEIVTSMYSLPSAGEVDPTPVLTPFFLLFFGMMMSDIGYGFGMLICSIIMLKFMDLEGGAKKIAKLILYSSIPTIIFGALYGGVFGVSIKPLWVNPLDNPMLILGISVVLGVLHLVIGLGVKGYQLIRSGHVLDAVFDVGTLYAIIFGIAWYAAGTQGIVGGTEIGKWLAITGVVGIFLTAGRANKGIGGKIGAGLFGVYGLTSYVGDALSYSRLMALGLATGLIGNAFNIMIGLMGEGITLPKLILGPIILIAGHTFNLLINALGSYVHTSRLQYVEFFGKFYEGGGKAFEPLKIKTKYIKVKEEK